MSTLPRLLQVQLEKVSHYVLVADDKDKDRVIAKLTNSQSIPFRWRYLRLELSNDVLRNNYKDGAGYYVCFTDSCYGRT